MRYFWAGIVVLLGTFWAVEGNAATKIWNNSQGNQRFNEAKNWTPLGVPGTGDVATFNATSTSDCQITSLARIAGIDIQAAYTGTMTQIKGVTVIVGASGFKQAGGTYVTNQTFGAGPVMHLRFDETAGPTAADSSGSGNNGTHVNSPTVSVAAPPGSFTNPRSLSFTGGSDHVSVADDASLDFGFGDFTLMAWIFPNAVASDKQVIMGKTDGASSGFRFITANGDGDRIKLVRGYSFNAGPQSNDGVLTNGAWHHVAAVVKGNSVSFFVNGVAAGGGTLPANSATTGTNLIIGQKSFAGSSANDFDGNIDDARIFNRALDAHEVASIAAGIDQPQPTTVQGNVDLSGGLFIGAADGVSVTGDFNVSGGGFTNQLADSLNTGLAAYFRFDETSGTAAADSSGNGNNGTHVNTPTISGTVPPVAFANPRSLGFDPTSSEHVLVPDSNSLDFGSGNFTIAAWILPNDVATAKQVIVDKTNGGSDGYRFITSDSDGDRIKLIRGFGFSGGVQSSNNVLSNGTWHHVAAVILGGNVTLYVNGQNVGSGALNGATTATTATSLFIGQKGNAGSSVNNFNGNLDEVRIYNRPLLASEISSLAAGLNNNAETRVVQLLDIDGSFNQTGGICIAPTTMHVGANFNGQSGTFTHNNGTVVLDGGSQTVRGSNTFFNLTKVTGAPATLSFEAGITQAVTGTTTFQGSTGNLLSLRSLSPGVQWLLAPQGTRTVSFVDVQDSVNTLFPMIAPPSSVNSGNNIQWFNPVTPLSVTASATSTALLLGATTSLSSVAVGGGGLPYSFAWTGPGGFTSSQQNPGLVSPALGANTYTVIVTDFVGITSTASVAVTVVNPISPNPTASPLVVSAGETTTLTANPSGGSGTYLSLVWTDPNGTTTTVAPGSSFQVAPPNDGPNTYTLTVTDDLGFTGTASVTVIHIASGLTVDSTVTTTLSGQSTDGSTGNVLLGDSFNLIGIVGGGSGVFQYAWSGPDGYSATVQIPGTVFPQSSGGLNYVFTVLDLVTGASLSSTVTVFVGEPLPNQGLNIRPGKVRYRARSSSTPQNPKDTFSMAIQGVDFNPGDRIAFSINNLPIGDLSAGHGLVLDGKGKAQGELGSTASTRFHQARLRYNARKRTLVVRARKGILGGGSRVVSESSGLSNLIFVNIFIDYAPADGTVDKTLVLPLLFKVKVRSGSERMESGRGLVP